MESPGLVPGDIVLLEAGDVVPADGRVVTSATLELQEAALPGESAPVAKDGAAVLDADTALGDRTNLVFQNTQVTRGTRDGGRDRYGVNHRDGSDRERDLDPAAALAPAKSWTG